MAQPHIGSAVPPKLSFAKIAAMPPPNIAPAVPNIIRDNKPRPPFEGSQHARTNSRNIPNVPQAIQTTPNPETHLEEINTMISGLSMTENTSMQPHTLPSGASGDSLADDQSQLSTSSLKQQSFDTKSMASVTTFAMDEKESIRPDDSASVRAVEEDDVHPGISRNSSFQHDADLPPSLSRSNVRMLGPNVTIAARRYPYTTMTNPPRFGDLPPGPVLETSVSIEPLMNVEGPVNMSDTLQKIPVIVNTTPDEKLIEALSSPKERLPLLQLEEKLILFIKTARDTVLELPPQNPFTRLLTHRLADYYNLAHHINDDNNSVRIFRTEYCPMPVSLAEIAKSMPIGSQQMTHATQVKIMRRGQLGSRQFSAGNSTAASSSVPSKTASENGVEPGGDEGLQSSFESTPSKDRNKLTREEREAQYKAARERIFGDVQESVTSESGSTGEASASMSRSSSSSGKKKQPRKIRIPKDDTFEARSSFVPSYTPIHAQSTYQQVYNDPHYTNGYVAGTYSPQTYTATQASNFQAYDPLLAYSSPSAYPAVGNPAYGAMDGWQNLQQNVATGLFNLQQHQQFSHQSMHSPGPGQFQPNLHPSLQQPPVWSPNQYQNVCAPSPAASNLSSWPGYVSTNAQGNTPYHYGQLPPQSVTSNIPFSSQHPVPGSFTGSKSLFNPQTRSFIPNNSSARGGARGGRKKGQGAGSGRTSGASSPAISNTGEGNIGKLKEDSLQQKYGTPANLPKKPPPSQVSPHFSGDHASNNSNGNSLLVNHNGKTPA